MSTRPAGIVQVPIDCLEPNPFNLRVHLDREELGGLMESIRERGLIHPILARPHPEQERYGQYQIICGERRFSAIKLLHEEEPDRFDHVPVRVERLDDTGALAAIMQENELREDWTPYERAAFFRAVYDDEHFPSIRKMAEAFGIGLTTMHRYLRIFDLPASIVDAFRNDRLTITQVEVILEADPEVQQDLADLLKQADYTKAEARRLAAKLTNPAKATEGDWIDALRRKLSSREEEGDWPVHVQPAGPKRIRVQIEAGSVKELRRLLNKINKEAKPLQE